MVDVSKFKKRKDSGVTVSNVTTRGYSRKDNQSSGVLDRQLWNIHDRGQDIYGRLEIPGLTVNGQINASGRIHTDTEISAPRGDFDNINVTYTGKFSYVETDDLTVHDTAHITNGEITNINSTNITTEFLNVTKSAHFAELIIDKIKAAGGSVVLSPADGFTIETEQDIVHLCDENGNDLNLILLSWNAEDDQKAVFNMWEVGDQAICENFNRAQVGVNTNISNTFFWTIVLGVGTYDPESNRNIFDSDASHEGIYFYNQPVAQFNGRATRRTGNKVLQKCYTLTTVNNTTEVNAVSFKDKKNYIIILTDETDYVDGKGKHYISMKGDVDPKVGDGIAMLGHRPQAQNNTEERKRQSAIYIAAYNSNIDAGLKAPLLAQYQGVNDFNLEIHRTTYFSAGDWTSDGFANYISGSFNIQNIDDLDIELVNFYIETDKSSIITDSTGVVDSNFEISISPYYMVNNNTPISLFGSGYRLYVLTTFNNSEKPNGPYSDNNDGVYDNKIKVNVRGLMDNSWGGKIDNFSIIIKNEDGNNVYRLNVPVIRNSVAKDGEMYKLNTYNELVQIDLENTLNIFLRYKIQHIIGNTIDYNTSGYTIRYYIDSEDGADPITGDIVHTYYNLNLVDGYYTTTRNKEYNSNNLSAVDRYITVQLVRNLDGDIVDTHVIPVTVISGAMLSITDEIKTRVQDTENDISYLTNELGYTNSYVQTTYNMASSALQTAQGFSTTVESIQTDLTHINNDVVPVVTQLQTDYSNISQTAKEITSEIQRISGVGGDNLIVNSSFQVSEENDLPERWRLYNPNIVTTHELGSINYLNLNNNGEAKFRGIEQSSIYKYDNKVQDFVGDHIYCFSFYGKKNSIYGEISCFIHYLDDEGERIPDSGTYSEQIYNTFDLTDDWMRYCFIFKTPNNNNIYAYNIMLEYIGDINRNDGATIPVIENDVDIMLPMLLDLGEATEERMDIYGLYNLNGETHVYNKYINTDYDIDAVPKWQGNSQDVSVASSQIMQTADLIRAQVGDCGVDITDKKIVLNGNTEINGALNLYDDTTGFILNGLGGITQISPKSVGLYADFRNITNTVFNRTETVAGTYVGKTNTVVTYNYVYRIYLGKYQLGKTITVNSISEKFYNNSDDNITGNSVNNRTVQIEDIYNSNTITTTIINGSTQLRSFSYTVNNPDADIYLIYNSSIGHQISQFGPLSQTPYCDFTIQYTVPNDAFTLIGYDGIGMNFGTGANIYFNKNEATFRYGNYGLKISNGTISKFIGERDNYNNEIWVNLNTPKIVVTSSDISDWPDDIDMYITTLNDDDQNQVIYLPKAPYKGRTVYIRKRGISNIFVYSNKQMYRGWSSSGSGHIVSIGDHLLINDAKEYKFTYDGYYWVVNYMAGDR